MIVSSDVGGYICGRTIRKYRYQNFLLWLKAKPAKYLSPNKTIFGFMGAMVFGMAVTADFRPHAAISELAYRPGHSSLGSWGKLETSCRASNAPSASRTLPKNLWHTTRYGWHRRSRRFCPVDRASLVFRHHLQPAGHHKHNRPDTS
ncbi:phosphatidate cytidylyltransferase [bacterium]|nr:MAG: phosphatidate cytidylyltransferase [bacterium]